MMRLRPTSASFSRRNSTISFHKMTEAEKRALHEKVLHDIKASRGKEVAESFIQFSKERAYYGKRLRKMVH